MGLQLLGSSFSPYLCIGIAFATFVKSENIRLLKDTLIISLNGSRSSVLNYFNIFLDMLLGLIALFGSMQLIKYSMSAGVVGEGKIISNLAKIM